MLFWPLANIDYIINSFCNRDQLSEAICEVITYQTHDRQKGVILSSRTTDSHEIFICLSYKNDELHWPFLFGDYSCVT